MITFKEAILISDMAGSLIRYMDNKGYIGIVSRSDAGSQNRIFTVRQVNALKLINKYKKQGFKLKIAVEKAMNETKDQQIGEINIEEV